MQGQIHSARSGPPPVAVAWNRGVEGAAARRPRARARPESHEISEALRRIGWGRQTTWPAPRRVCCSGRGRVAEVWYSRAMVVSRLNLVEFSRFHVI